MSNLKWIGTVGVAAALSGMPALAVSRQAAVVGRPAPAAKVAAKTSACVTCHQKVTPGIVTEHLAGAMGKSRQVGCADCHGSAHKSAKDANLAKLPTPQTCQKCHPDQVEQYGKGKHALAWVALEAMPGLQHQPTPVRGEGFTGCAACHKIGVKDAVKANLHYGTGACDSCHTRHTFSKKEALDPRACQTCHMGFDHPQWEMWSTSKHGTIWQIEGNSGRAPTCQTCHMQGGDHGVLTSWGFLALRLPEDDKDWLADRVEILQALGVLDAKGTPTERLELVKAGKMARLTREEFQSTRDKMVNTCGRCHSKSYTLDRMKAGDDIIKASDRVMANAIREVKRLYADGLLEKPAGWKYAPDLLQFYDAKSTIEQDLYRMMLEYRMRAFQGAFHINPDYMHWYGWAPLNESLVRIRDEAGKMRAAAASRSGK